MRRLGIIAMFCIMVLLVSCSSISEECEKPFIEKDGECCLDLDDDGICDTEKNKTEGQAEPEVVVEETKEVPVEKKEPKEEKKEKIEEKVPAITGSVVGVEDEEITEDDIQEFKESASIDAKDLLEQLMKTYTEDVESYKYNFAGDWYYFRGNKMKIKLGESIHYSSQDIAGKHYPVFYIDTVYIDIINKTATGYCEGNDPRLGNKKCAELDLQDVQYPLNYAHFYTKRPDEWLFEVYTLDPEVKTETGNYYLGPRKVKRLEYTGGLKKVIMYYDESIGLPIKINTFINDQFSKVWLYDFLSINTVKDKHVRHRSADEISSKEGFYSTAN